MRPGCLSRSGFSLLEHVVAMGLTAIVMVMMLKVFMVDQRLSIDNARAHDLRMKQLTAVFQLRNAGKNNHPLWVEHALTWHNLSKDPTVKYWLARGSPNWVDAQTLQQWGLRRSGNGQWLKTSGFLLFAGVLGQSLELNTGILAGARSLTLPKSIDWPKNLSIIAYDAKSGVAINAESSNRVGSTQLIFNDAWPVTLTPPIRLYCFASQGFYIGKGQGDDNQSEPMLYGLERGRRQALLTDIDRLAGSEEKGVIKAKIAVKGGQPQGQLWWPKKPAVIFTQPKEDH